jgi:hypothetical protein
MHLPLMGYYVCEFRWFHLSLPPISSHPLWPITWPNPPLYPQHLICIARTSLRVKRVFILSLWSPRDGSTCYFLNRWLCVLFLSIWIYLLFLSKRDFRFGGRYLVEQTMYLSSLVSFKMLLYLKDRVELRKSLQWEPNPFCNSYYSFKLNLPLIIIPWNISGLFPIYG